MSDTTGYGFNSQGAQSHQGKISNHQNDPMIDIFHNYCQKHLAAGLVNRNYRHRKLILMIDIRNSGNVSTAISVTNICFTNSINGIGCSLTTQIELFASSTTK